MRNISALLVIAITGSVFAEEATADYSVLNDPMPAIMATISKPAEEKASGAKLDYTLKFSVESNYMLTSGGIISKDPIAIDQFILGISGVNVGEYDLGRFYLGTWNSTGLNPSHRYGSTYADEIDLYGGWTKSFAKWVEVDACAAYYDMHQLKRLDDDIVRFDLTARTLKLPWFQIYSMASQYIASGKDWPGPGTMLTVGADRSINLPFKIHDRPASLSLEVSSVFNLTDKFLGSKHSGPVDVIGKAGLTLPVSKRMSVDVHGTLVQGVGDQRGRPQDVMDHKIHKTGGIMFVYKF